MITPADALLSVAGAVPMGAPTTLYMRHGVFELFAASGAQTAVDGGRYFVNGMECFLNGDLAPECFQIHYLDGEGRILHRMVFFDRAYHG